MKKVKKDLIGSDDDEIEIINEEVEETSEDTNVNDIKKQYMEIKDEEIKEVAEDELFTFI